MTVPYYSDDWVTIYHGDCREWSELPGDVMVTDPPYGMAHRSGWNGAFGGCEIVGDETTDSRDVILSRWVPRPALVFGRWSVAKPAGTRTVLTWDKGDLIGMGDLSLPWGPTTEEVYVLGSGFEGKRGRSVLRYQGIGPYQQARGERLHPTQKPIELLRDLVQKCPSRWMVLDPFMGSGTTLRAAKDVGRKSIGIEIEERYCEVAAKRCSQETLGLAV